MRCLALLLLTLSVLPGCTRPGTSSSPAASTSPPLSSEQPPQTPPSTTVVSSSASVDLPAPPSGPWQQALREHRWRDAAATLDALSEAERNRPEIRLARAKAARMLKDLHGVVSATEQLQIPIASEVIDRFRAEATLEVGPYEEAAVYYAARPGAVAALRAGLALERAGKLAEARRQMDRAVSLARGDSQQAAARTARARLAVALGQNQEAMEDARWVVLQVPQYAAESEKILKFIHPNWIISGQDRLARAKKLAQAGVSTAALAELSAAEQSLGAGGNLLRERGLILYKLRRYAEAAEVLGKVARQNRSQEDAFLAARALSRANKDAEAIQAYHALIKTQARGPIAEEATYLSARLALLLGRAEEAERGFMGYLKRFKKGKFRNNVAYELALAQIATGHPSRAQKGLGALARAEDNPAEAARLRELEGVAALKAGNKEGAKALFLRVIQDQPLSWPALMARERLISLGESPSLALEALPERPIAPLEIKLPTAVQWFHQLGLEEEAEEVFQREERSFETAYASRAAEALCEAYGQLDPARRRYRLGQGRVRLEQVQKAPGLSNRWAWDCLYPTPYVEQIRGVESREQLPSGLLHAVMRQESAFDPSAQSPALAQGLLQLLPTTAQEVARRNQMTHEEGSLMQPAVNIDLGARYLAMLGRMWKGNWILAVASYNAGPRAISRWLEHNPQLEADLWVAQIPYGETRSYVARVLGNMARYTYLVGGESKIPRFPLVLNGELRAGSDAF